MKGWWLYNIQDKEFIISRDVIFQESMFPYASGNSEISLNNSESMPKDYIPTPKCIVTESVDDLNGQVDQGSPVQPLAQNLVDVGYSFDKPRPKLTATQD